MLNVSSLAQMIIEEIDMIEFEDVVSTIKELNNVEILSEDLDNYSLHFKKSDTRYFLSKPKRETSDPSADFSISMAFQTKAINDGKLTYTELLEIVNEQNSNANDLCRTYYNKDTNLIFIEAKHIFYAADTQIYKKSINERLNSYLTITILGMLILLLETVGNTIKSVSALMDQKQGGSENEKNK